MFKKAIVSLIEKYPRVSGSLRIIKEALDISAPTLKTPWGFKLAGHSEMAAGNFEPVETAVIRSLLEDVDLFINVGANIGYYCCHALSMGKETIAVEPSTRNLHYLLKNIKENGWSHNAQVFPLALGSKPDVLQMWGSGTGASLVKGWASNPDSLVKLVPVLTLDRILRQELKNKHALILVDIEGEERRMLVGALGCLTNTPKPIWIVEIASTEHQPSGVSFNPDFIPTFKIFIEHGYDIFPVNDLENAITLNELEDAARKQSRFRTNNFVFKEKSSRERL